MQFMFFIFFQLEETTVSFDNIHRIEMGLYNGGMEMGTLQV